VHLLHLNACLNVKNARSKEAEMGIFKKTAVLNFFLLNQLDIIEDLLTRQDLVLE
jgi:hypothetical protein